MRAPKLMETTSAVSMSLRRARLGRSPGRTGIGVLEVQRRRDYSALQGQERRPTPISPPVE